MSVAKEFVHRQTCKSARQNRDCSTSFHSTVEARGNVYGRLNAAMRVSRLDHESVWRTPLFQRVDSIAVRQFAFLWRPCATLSSVVCCSRHLDVNGDNRNRHLATLTTFVFRKAKSKQTERSGVLFAHKYQTALRAALYRTAPVGPSPVELFVICVTPVINNRRY